MAAIIVLSVQFGGEYNDDFELPNTESTTAQDLLGELSGTAGTGAGLEGQVVWSPDSGAIDDAPTQEAMTKVLTEISTSPGVTCVFSPYNEGEQLGAGCPPPAEESGGEQGEQPPAEEQPAEEPSPEAAGALATNSVSSANSWKLSTTIRPTPAASACASSSGDLLLP
jgi:hypothetical protein